ncbi:MAG: hypothetical protein AAF942_04850 [Pseudomonadota bacterium]
MTRDMGRMKNDHLKEEEEQRRATVLGELDQEGVDIFCWCNRCGHNTVVPVAVFAAQFGPSFPVPDVGAHLRCSGCGSKDVAARPAWPSLGQVTSHHESDAGDADQSENSIQDIAASDVTAASDEESAPESRHEIQYVTKDS